MASAIKPTHKSNKHQIFLVEDHPITREGFAQLLNVQDDLQICGQAGAAQEALVAIERLKPDLIIVDISLVGMSGLELLKELVKIHSDLPVLILSTHDENLYAERALRAGAKGYIMKSEPTRRILAAIRQVLRGKVYISERMNELILNKLTKGAAAEKNAIELLSDRELEVFQLIGQGLSTTEIATRLNMAPSTAANHRAHIQDKLHLEKLSELVCRAVQWVQNQRPQ